MPTQTEGWLWGARPGSPRPPSPQLHYRELTSLGSISQLLASSPMTLHPVFLPSPSTQPSPPCSLTSASDSANPEPFPALLPPISKGRGGLTLQRGKKPGRRLASPLSCLSLTQHLSQRQQTSHVPSALRMKSKLPGLTRPLQTHSDDWKGFLPLSFQGPCILQSLPSTFSP